jgi:archaellum biogenesis ATPase FlaH
MYRKEVNERSPMRVFEGSMHGGLGRGNIGVVVARPGVGKTALLVQIALDDLLRDRKVLHISHEHAVDHVRAYYDEIFHELAGVMRLEEPEAVRVDIEKNRLIYSHLASRNDPPSMRGGNSSIQKILSTVDFAREYAHFEPDVIILDAFDFTNAKEEALAELRKLAQERSVELWIAATVDVRKAPASGLPGNLGAFEKELSVVVFLEPERDIVRLRLLKDHDNPQVADLHLRLDPHTMRVIDEDVRPASDRPRDPRRFKLFSGGCKGAEAAFGASAERWGMSEVNYTFSGHRFLERNRGVTVLSEDELSKGDFSLVYVSKRLNRVLSEIPLVRSVLQTIWYQVNAASQVFVVGAIQDDGTVRGGTGWGAELARLWKKPLWVFDQGKRGWFRWSGKSWELASPAPVITSESFAGLGTQNLTEDGRKAIEDLFFRSFGEPQSR